MDGDIRQTQRRYRQLIDGAIELWNEPAADDSHDRALASLTADHERSLERNNLDTVRGRSAIVKSVRVHRMKYFEFVIAFYLTIT